MNSDNNRFSSLEELGWDAFFQEQLEARNASGQIPARITSDTGALYRVYCEKGELVARLSGKMRSPENEYRRPAVGDWTLVQLLDESTCLIQTVLDRKSKFSRKAAGLQTREQVVAANVDTVFIVCGMDGGRSYNLRRIERYLTLASNSGATPVIVLNKSDLCPDPLEFIRNVEEISSGVNVYAVSAMAKTGLDSLQIHITSGRTAAFIGPSGVGKSALINALLGSEKQQTGRVRSSDFTGKHTTTRRDLILIPEGGMVIDTPGMRELQLWGDEDDLKDTFQDIAGLALRCKFHDCSHNREPGCAVRNAIENGELDPLRFESYRKLQTELEYLAAREDNSTRLLEKQRWKKISQWVKKDINRYRQGRF